MAEDANLDRTAQDQEKRATDARIKALQARKAELSRSNINESIDSTVSKIQDLIKDIVPSKFKAQVRPWKGRILITFGAGINPTSLKFLFSDIQKAVMANVDSVESMRIGDAGATEGSIIIRLN